MSIAIAPRFTETELQKIDTERGDMTRTEYVKICTLRVMWLRRTEETKTTKPKQPTHECGTKLKILSSFDPITWTVDGGYALCSKCHTSKKLTKEEYYTAKGETPP